MRLTTPLTAAFLTLTAGAADAGTAPVLSTHGATASQSAAERGYLGIQMTVEDGAMVVQDVRPGSPAENAGLAPGDRITRVGDHEVGDGAELTEHLSSLRAGSTVEIRVERDGWTREFEVELAGRSAVGLEPDPGTASEPEGETTEPSDSIDVFRQRWNDRNDARDADADKGGKGRFRFEFKGDDDDARVYEMDPADLGDLGAQIRAQVERELAKHKDLGLKRDGGFALRAPRIERGEIEALHEEMQELRREVAELRGLHEELAKLKDLRQEVQELVRSLRHD